MTLIFGHTTAGQHHALRQAILLFALVGGILIGLLAMHTISTAAGNHGESVPVMMAEMATMNDPASTVTGTSAAVSQDCGGACDAGHVMAGMACVLVLLFSALAVGLTRPRCWSLFFSARRPSVNSGQSFGLAPVQRLLPPDLNALCISRT